MIATTSKNSQFTENYLMKNQSVADNRHQEKSHKMQQENFQFSSDQVRLTYSAETTPTYSSSLSLEKKSGDGYDLLRGLVLNIFKDQGIDYNIATDDAEIDLRALTPEKAQELITDDGYFGVEKTSERIVQLAIGIAGGDPTRIDAIRQGIDNGFQQALDAFGGELPDISHDTYNTVMHKLDDWAGVDTANNSPESQIQVKS